MLQNFLGAYLAHQNLAAFANFPGWSDPDVQAALADLPDDMIPPDLAAGLERATLTAYYTPPPLVEAIMGAVTRLPLAGRKALDIGCGTGRFLRPLAGQGLRRLVGIDNDPLAAAVAADSVPGATIRTTDLKHARLADGTFDLAVGNPPYGGWAIGDIQRPELADLNIRDYCVLRALHALKPGGLAVLLVSHGFLDSKRAQARQLAASLADLLAVRRLPSDLFAGAAVTVDLLVFQRRESPGTGACWVDGDRLTVEEGEATAEVNAWFRERPGDCLGTQGVSSRGERTLLEVRGVVDWAALGRDLAQVLGGLVMPPLTGPVEGRDFGGAEQAAEVGGLLVHAGRIWRREPTADDDDPDMPLAVEVTERLAADGTPRPLNAREHDRLRAIVALGAAAAALVAGERAAPAEETLDGPRRALREAYQDYRKRHGPLHRPGNLRLVLLDPTRAGLLLALEQDYRPAISKRQAARRGCRPRPEQVAEAPILWRRVGFPTPVPQAATIDEAVTVSLARRGRVDLDFMAGLLGCTPAEVEATLPATVYRDPVTRAWVPRDELLSGDVAEKLEAAERAGDTDTAALLRDALPERVPFEDIHAPLGAAWLPEHLLRDFYLHLTTDQARVARGSWLGTWRVVANAAPASAADYAEWSIEGHLDPPALYEAALNQRSLKLYKTIDGPDGRERRVLDLEATNRANLRLRELQQAFTAWLGDDEARRETAADAFNQRFVRYVTRRYDALPLTLDGLNPEIVPYHYQAGAVAHSVCEPAVLFDHPVGAGKTLELAMAAMAARQLGLASRPLMVVPDHLVGQVAGDVVRFFPAARVLTPEAGGGWRRWRLFAQLATSEYDVAIIGRSAFTRLPVDREALRAFVADEKEAYRRERAQWEGMDGADKGRSGYLLKARAEATLRRIERWAENAGKKDPGLCLSDLGIDLLLVDEAHDYKNLSFITGLSDLRGINPDGSQRAMAFQVALHGLRARGGRVVFATGTPIVNSVAEQYTMQRYLCPDRLKALGIEQFDSWVSVFSQPETRIERRPAGDYGPVTRLARFANLPELQALWAHAVNHLPRSVMEAEQRERNADLAVPRLQGDAYQRGIAPASIYQRGMTRKIYRRFDNFEGNDNALAAMTDARKAAADVRLLVPECPRFPQSKVVLCAKNILRTYREWNHERGTQLVFCDLGVPHDSARMGALRDLQARAVFDGEAARELANLPQEDLDALDQDTSVSLYDDLKALLIAGGIPAEEILFAQTLRTDQARLDAYEAVNDGRVRVLCGSTVRMGTGMNVQERLVALHDLDAPWRPADLEQRHGRILRQGNVLASLYPDFAVAIWAYATEASFDAGMWAAIETKAGFIAQLRAAQGDVREMDDVNLESANAGTMKALASGDPRELEHVELSQALKELEAGQRAHLRRCASLKGEIRRLEEEQAGLPALRDALAADCQALAPALDTRHYRHFGTPAGVHFLRQKEAADGLREGVACRRNRVGAAELGTYRGLPVQVTITAGWVAFTLGQAQSPVAHYHAFAEVSWKGLLGRLHEAAVALPRRLTALEQRAQALPRLITDAREGSERPCPYSQRIAETAARLDELHVALGRYGELPEAIETNPDYRAAARLVGEADADADEAGDPVRELELLAHAAALDEAFRRGIADVLSRPEDAQPAALAGLRQDMEAIAPETGARYEDDYQALLRDLADEAATWRAGAAAANDAPVPEVAGEGADAAPAPAPTLAPAPATSEAWPVQGDLFAA